MSLKKSLLMMGVSCIVMQASYAVTSMPNGWYVSGLVGKTRISDTRSGATFDLNKMGLSGSVGYKFMPYVGVEGEYSYYGEGDVKTGGVKAYSNRLSSYGIAVKGMLPLENSGIDLYAKLGAERLTSRLSTKDSAAASSLGYKSNETASGVLMGLGVSYNVMPELGVDLGWQRSAGSSRTGTVDLYGLGLTYVIG